MTEVRTCQNPSCGKEFAAKRKNSRYCCLKCSRKAYQLSHPEVFVRNNRRWIEKHPDSYKETIKRYIATHRKIIKARARAHYLKNRELIKSRVLRYKSLHKKEIACLASFRYIDLVERCESDHLFYAQQRAKQREQYRRWYGRNFVRKRPYSPALNRRIPDYLRRGEDCLDVRSKFLFENATASQKAYAKELAIERKEYREVMNMV